MLYLTVAAAFLFSCGDGDFVLSVASEQLTADESFRAYPYNDSQGNLLIGYGTLLSSGLSSAERDYLGDTNIHSGITKEQGSWLLRHRLDQHVRELKRRWPYFCDQPPRVKIALANMVYQLGVGGLLVFDFLDHLVNKQYDMAIDSLRGTLWARCQTSARAQRIIDDLQRGIN